MRRLHIKRRLFVRLVNRLMRSRNCAGSCQGRKFPRVPAFTVTGSPSALRDAGGAAGGFQTLAVGGQVTAAAEGPALMDHRPHGVGVIVDDVLPHVLGYPALQIPGAVPAHRGQLPGQVVLLMGILLQVGQLLRIAQVAAIVIGGDIFK